MLVMFFELLAAPPCPVSLYMKLCKFFTCGIIKMLCKKYFQQLAFDFEIHKGCESSLFGKIK